MPLASDARRARLRTGLVLAGLLGTAALLPGPARLTHDIAGTDPVGVLAAAMLLAAAVVVWALLAWAAVVGVTVVLARMSGGPGPAARLLLLRLAPASARRVLLVAAGVTLAVGASACGTAAGSAGAGGHHAGLASVTAVTASANAAVTRPMTTAATGPTTATTLAPAREQAAAATPGGDAGAGIPTDPRPGVMPDLDWPVGGGEAVASHPAPASAAPPLPASTAASTAATPTAATATGATATGATATGAAATGATETGATATAAIPTTPPPASSTDAAPAATSKSQARPLATGQVSPGVAPTAPAPTAPAFSTPPPQSPDPRGTVIVRPGDSLWSIAAEHLPAGASDERIDATWRAWYAANRAVIGADPDLILPGQELHAPDQKVIQP